MTSISTSSAPAVRASRFHRRIVLAALARMPHGSLTMTFPDGSRTTFGHGSNPRHAQHGTAAKIHVHDEQFFRRCVLFGDIGLAESYMAGEWETNDLEQVVAWFILNDTSAKPAAFLRLGNRLLHAFRANSVVRSRANIAAHYDLSNDFFATFLDPSMTYSSALFRAEESLEDAQIAKIERLCRALELKPYDRVLEIGSGWGAFSRYAAKHYGCHVTTITISQQQYDWAARRIAEEKLEGLIDLQLIDYRKVSGPYDKIVSVEMIEAVGFEFYDTFFTRLDELLAPNGLIALQAITSPESRFDGIRKGVDFIQKHIFPGGLIPSVGALMDSMQRVTDFTIRDLFDFGPSYARTLGEWSHNFEVHLGRVRTLGFDETFIRKWRYYLMYCKAAFEMRHISVVQLLLTRPNNHAISGLVR
jgi:cyclopropane-fatty-acyl-phospholipid synthase